VQPFRFANKTLKQTKWDEAEAGSVEQKNNKIIYRAEAKLYIGKIIAETNTPTATPIKTTAIIIFFVITLILS
jgi:hypothetical protein